MWASLTPQTRWDISAYEIMGLFNLMWMKRCGKAWTPNSFLGCLPWNNTKNVFLGAKHCLDVSMKFFKDAGTLDAATLSSTPQDDFAFGILRAKRPQQDKIHCTNFTCSTFFFPARLSTKMRSQAKFPKHSYLRMLVCQVPAWGLQRFISLLFLTVLYRQSAAQAD